MEDRNVGQCFVRLDSVLRSAANLELVGAGEALRREVVGSRSGSGNVEEAGLVLGAAGHHLAPLGVADDHVVDVEAFESVVGAAGTGFGELVARELAGRVGVAADRVDQVSGRVLLS